MKLNNRLAALTTTDELKELSSLRKKTYGHDTVGPNHNPKCTLNHPQVMFAFWQSDFQGGKIPYWHVMNQSPFFHSTLSMQGLKEYRLL